MPVEHAHAAPSAANLVEIRGLHYAIGNRPIFADLSLDIPRGRVTAIMGPSGCGKTTLLKLIGGSLKPDRGRVLVDGRDVSRVPRAELFSIRRRMGVLFQSAALFTDLSVFENVAFPLRVHTRLPEDSLRDLVLMKLNAVGLRGARNLMPNELSGGMARRVALARAIALDPDIIMYDEPFAGQDPIAMGVLLSLIRNLNEALGTTSLVVSHDVHETASIADRIFVLCAGGVIGTDAAEVLKDHPEPEVRQFINGTPDGPVPFHYPAPDYQRELLGDGTRPAGGGRQQT